MSDPIFTTNVRTVFANFDSWRSDYWTPEPRSALGDAWDYRVRSAPHKAHVKGNKSCNTISQGLALESQMTLEAFAKVEETKRCKVCSRMLKTK
jgi:hypothetical protein